MSSYSERLHDPTFDAYQGNHAPDVQKFSLQTPTPVNAQDLMAAIASGEHPHLAFALCTQLHGQIKVTCLHRIFHYPGQLGVLTQWDTYVFGLLGNVVAQQFPLVYAGDEIFAPLGPLHVPTIKTTMDEAALQN